MMDPITTAIVAAVTAGAVSGIQETGNNIISDTYNALKTKIAEKFGPENKMSKTITELEQEPDFKPHQSTLAARIEQSNASKDEELLQLVQALKEALESHPKGQGDTKNFNINVSDNAKVGVIGDNPTVKGGIFFDNNKG